MGCLWGAGRGRSCSGGAGSGRLSTRSAWGPGQRAGQAAGSSACCGPVFSLVGACACRSAPCSVCRPVRDLLRPGSPGGARDCGPGGSASAGGARGPCRTASDRCGGGACLPSRGHVLRPDWHWLQGAAADGACASCCARCARHADRQHPGRLWQPWHAGRLAALPRGRLWRLWQCRRLSCSAASRVRCRGQRWWHGGHGRICSVHGASADAATRPRPDRQHGRRR